MKRKAFESEFLYGLHEPGGEWLMERGGAKGWILFTESIGYNPNDHSGKSYSRWSDNGYSVMVRLNNGYSPNGTIPVSGEYSNFAKRCANFVKASSGCHIWIVGNETNYSIERPTLPDGSREVITPSLYARCYSACRGAIKAVSSDDYVIVSPVAPWNAETRYEGNQDGDWVKYFRDILLLLGPSGCDGFGLHTYTHEANPNQISDSIKMSPPFQDRHFNFRAYMDFMNAVPASMRHLPCYITEADQNVEWKNENTGWVRRAYGEIDFWNKQPGNQKIRSLILYRWPKVPGDKWWIDGKAGVHDDFAGAVSMKYRWDYAGEIGTPVVDDVKLRIKLLDAAEKNQVIQFNTSAAIQKVIFSDGFVPNSSEFVVSSDRVVYVAQRAERLDTGEVRVYYVIVGDWQNVKYVSASGFHLLGKPFSGTFPITQKFGENPQNYAQFSYGGVPLLGHNGVDFGIPTGTPILSMDDGIVVRAALDLGGFGRYVVVSHSFGESWYAHLSRIDVSVGKEIRRGEQLGLSGSTGNSTGPHLHLGVRLSGYKISDGFGGFSDPSELFV